MSSKQKVFIKNLQFRTHSYQQICAFLSCAFTNVFQAKSIHYTSYNSGHILIINFVLSSHVLLQLSSKQKVFITKSTIPDTFLSTNLCSPLMCFYKCLPNKKHSLHKLQFRTHSHHKLCALLSCAFTNVFQTKSIHYRSYNSGHNQIRIFVLSSHHNENYKNNKIDIFSKPLSRFKTGYIVLKLLLILAAHSSSSELLILKVSRNVPGVATFLGLHFFATFSRLIASCTASSVTFKPLDESPLSTLFSSSSSILL